MPGKARIFFSASALKDLEDLQDYYAKEGVAEVGIRLSAELIASVERLIDHPLSGRVVPEFQVEHLREIIHPPFRMVYRHDPNRIRIVRIWRSERLLKMP